MSKSTEKQKNTLTEYFQSLSEESPRVALRDEVMEECGISKEAFYRWVSGKVVPDKLKREKVAEIIGIPVEQLFPEAYKDQEQVA